MQEKSENDQTLKSLRAGVLSATMIVVGSFAAAIAFSGTPLEAQPTDAVQSSR